MFRTAALEKWKLKATPNTHVFEWQEWESGGRLCTIMTFDEFVRVLIQTSPEHYWHELVYPDRPCRLVIDCDKSLAIDSAPVDEARVVCDIHHAVMTELDDPSVAPPRVVRDMRDDKFSLHLYWDVWFKNPSHVYAFVMDVIKHGTYQGVTIDTQIYPRGDYPKTLRMPYSRKLNKKGKMIPANHRPSFSPEVFCGLLMGFHSEHSTIWKSYLPVLPNDLLDSSHRPEYQEFCLTTSYVVSYSKTDPKPITDWLAMYFPKFNADSVKQLHDGGWNCRSSMFCMSKNKFHHGNGSYVKGCVDGTISVGCTDEQCPVQFKLPFTDAMIRASLNKVQVDWDIINILLACPATVANIDGKLKKQRLN